jgi:hypothetical protein
MPSTCMRGPEACEIPPDLGRRPGHLQLGSVEVERGVNRFGEIGLLLVE